MMSFVKKIAFGAASVALLATAPAQAACWNDDAVEAAMVRDLETMLMVSALRCKLSGTDILPEYNRFINTSRPALTDVNTRLRAHFGNGFAALNAYDSYVTKVANRYGSGADGLNCNDMQSILQAANAESGSRTGLARLARDAAVEPLLPGGRCTVAIAQR